MIDHTRRGLLTSAAVAIATLPALRAAAQTSDAATETGDAAGTVRATVDPASLVDPELRPVLEAILKQETGLPPGSLDMLGPKAVAALLSAFRASSLISAVPVPAVADAAPAVERMIPGPEGAPEVRVFVIGVMPGGRRPAVLHIHGGGFIAGRPDDYITFLQAHAVVLDCVIVTVDYRLAPETPFPGSLEDNYAALRWLHDNADELGADPSRIALMGESAGGGHAAMLAIAARDRGEVPVLFQSLTYPMLDDHTGSSRQLPAQLGAFLWTPALNRFGWQSLLGQTPGGESAPGGAVPARVENLAGLPPAWIGVGAIDLFVDEDIEYGRRLVLAGVPTELLVVPGAYHGFDAVVSDAAVSRAFNLARANALARAFGTTPIGELPPFSAPAAAP